MTLRNTFFYLLMLVTVWLVSCKHEPAVPAGNNNNSGGNNSGTSSNNTCNADSVYFEKDIMPIINSNCAMSGCHGNGASQDGVDLTSYDKIMSTAEVRSGNPGDSKLFEVITEDDEDDRMPLPPNPRLSQAQINTIEKWIRQGAKNNTCKSGCDTGAVTFSKSVMPVMTANCIGCHSGSVPSGGIGLTTHAQVKTVAQNGRLVGAISHANGYVPMPQGGNKLPDCTINQIQVWIAAGAPNN